MKRLQKAIRDGLYDEISLEIGFGRGEFILQQSQLDPNGFYIGIEIQRELWEYAKTFIPENQKNLILINGDATSLIKDLEFPDNLSNIHIYFPSPYHSIKYQSESGKLVSQEFFSYLTKKLSIGGVIRIVTDDLATHILAKSILSKWNFWFQNWIHFNGVPFGLYVNTTFELSYASKGTSYTIYAQKL